jgi:hypothetical protein
VNLEEIGKYLPTYLSHGSKVLFLAELQAFEEAKRRPFYTSKLWNEKVLYQGDGLEGLLIVRPPAVGARRVRGMILSNTCDIDPGNARLYSSSICYAPILNLSKYLSMLSQEGIAAERITNHTAAIRGQRITQIFYLPAGAKLVEDGIVFLDQISSCSPEQVNAQALPAGRIFTLTDFGAWLFALKLSIHFCRINDEVERGNY